MATSEEIGLAGERAVARLLEDRGFRVQRDGHNSHHDLMLNGSTTVEIKTAYPSAGRHGNKERWQFKLRDSRPTRWPMEEDVLILRCLDGDQGEPWHYIIPGRDLRAGLTHIETTSGRDRYRGRYRCYLERWDLLAGIVAARNGEGRQIAMPGLRSTASEAVLDGIPF